jgi:hypothetical protein
MKLKRPIYLEATAMLWRRLAMVAFITTILAGLSACASVGPDPRDLRIETSVSSDGQWIAVLQNSGTEKSKVKVMQMDQRQWIDIQAPPLTSSIRFGLRPSQLLLTHWKSNADATAELSGVDLSKPSFPRTTLYIGTGLGYPMELEDGQVLVRACYTTSQNRCHRAVGVHWVLMENGEVKTKYSSTEPLNYSQPNYIRGSGFYWEGFISFDQFKFLGFIKSGEKASARDFPDNSIKFKKTDLETFRCDFSSERCLKSFVPSPKNPGEFQYDTTIIYKSQNCQLTGVLGWSDGMSITPNGLFGVKSLSPSWESSRHVVYIKFQPNACEPTDIQHIEIN